MPLVKPYTTIARVRAETRNEDSSLDEKFETAINDASRAIDEFCKRDFWFHDYTGSGYSLPVNGDKIFPPWPIISLTGITYEGITITDYNVFAQFIECTGEELGITSGGMAVIKGTFGYALAESESETTPPPTLPPQIIRAATMIAAVWSGEYAIERVSLQNERTSIASSDIPDEAMNLLAPYRALVL